MVRMRCGLAYRTNQAFLFAGRINTNEIQDFSFVVASLPAFQVSHFCLFDEICLIRIHINKEFYKSLSYFTVLLTFKLWSKFFIEFALKIKDVVLKNLII